MRNGKITANCSAVTPNGSTYFDNTLELTWAYVIDPSAPQPTTFDRFWAYRAAAVEFEIVIVTPEGREVLESGIRNLATAGVSRGSVQDSFLQWLKHFS